MSEKKPNLDQIDIQPSEEPDVDALLATFRRREDLDGEPLTTEERQAIIRASLDEGQTE